MLSVLLVAAQFVSAQVLSDTLDIAILGDSNTWLGGDDCDKPKGWNTWFASEIRPRTCKSYARSGATWTNTSTTKMNVEENIGVLGDDNVIYNQIIRLRNELDSNRIRRPDLIIIAAGTNDAWFEDKRPNAFSLDKAYQWHSTEVSQQPSDYLTIQQSVSFGIHLLREMLPEAKIVLMTPMYTTAVSKSKIRQCGDIIEYCARQTDCFLIRQDKVSPVDSAKEKKRKNYTYDGTHTSIQGAKANGKILAGIIKKQYDIK